MTLDFVPWPLGGFRGEHARHVNDFWLLGFLIMSVGGGIGSCDGPGPVRLFLFRILSTDYR